MIILILTSHCYAIVLTDSHDSTDIIKLTAENFLLEIFQLHLNLHACMDEEFFISVALICLGCAYG